MFIGKDLVNLDASHYAGSAFTSTVDPRTVNPNVLSGSKFVGGRKINRKKINKISRKYKMKGSRRRVKSRVRRIKSRVRSRYSKSKSKSRSKSRLQRGGSAFEQTYSTGGHLSPSLSAMANPVPFQIHRSTNLDNYNHFTKQ
jgi:hypothetical protein